MTQDHRRLAAIVSADVAGYSLLMGRDDSATLAGLKAHQRELIDPKIAEYGGRIVKTTGDGFLLEFPSVVNAVRCAVDVQRGMAERNAGVPVDQRIEFRVGVHVGDIIIDGDDIFGDGVNVAARLQTLAEIGGICLSAAVQEQFRGIPDVNFVDLGEQKMKNIERSIHVYRVALAANDNLPTLSSASDASPDLVMIIDVEATPASQSPITWLSYELARSETLVRIYPSMEYLETLRRGGPIEPLIDWRSVPISWNFPNLDFKVLNNGNRTVFLTELCFDIATSRLDPSPILVLRQDTYGNNALHFAISNEGWGPVLNLRARFHLTPLGSSAVPANFREPFPYEVIVGDFVDDTNVSVAACIQAAGVDLAALQSLPVVNSWQSSETDKVSFVFVGADGQEQTVSSDEVKKLQIARLGEFKNNAAILSGELIYDVVPADAGSREHRVKFSTVVHIINEHRTGAPAPPTHQYATKFDVDGHSYQRRVSISHVLKPGEADRFMLKIGVDKSSLHSFTVRLAYNDGLELTSPRIELLALVPRSGAQSVAKRATPIFGDGA